MQRRAGTSDLRKYVRHALTAGGALLLIAAAGLDRADPNGLPGATPETAQHASLLNR